MDDKKDPLWKALTEDVDPLESNLYTEKDISRLKKPKTVKTEHKAKIKVSALPEQPSKAFKPPQTNSIDPNASSNRMDRKTEIRLKKGMMSYEAKMDFHGMGVDKAYGRFVSFLEGAYLADKRMVLVVTGKGDLLKGGGIIRQSFLRWINEPTITKYILTCQNAQPKDGGAGAFYLYLKKRK